MNTPFFKTQYNHDTAAESQRTGSDGNWDQHHFNLSLCEKKDIGKKMPGKTKQSEAEQADINTIVKNFGVTGHLPLVERPPTYGDFTEVQDYFEAQNLVAETNAKFYALDADTRSEFQNNPGKWAAYVEDRMLNADFDALRKMGVIAPGDGPKEPETPTATPAGTPAAEPPKAPTGA